MPRFEWREDDMSTSLDFFPLVGAVIGALECLINIGPAAALDPVVRALASVLIPILVTGGFHLDGFMDTSDALNSYGEPGKKLEILKDPHIGAFAVISLVKLLIAAIAFSVLLLTWKDPEPETVVACGLIFVESRCLSGLTSLFFKKARKSGMLSRETESGRKGTVVLLIIQLTAASAVMLILDPFRGCGMIASFALFTLYYRYKTSKEFGGVTGDTAGYYVSMSETLALCVTAILNIFLP